MPKGNGEGKLAFRDWIMDRSCAGVYPSPPMTPSPPARETAEARGVVEVCAIPARRMGCGMRRREVRGVLIVGVEEAIVALRSV